MVHEREFWDLVIKKNFFFLYHMTSWQVYSKARICLTFRTASTLISPEPLTKDLCETKSDGALWGKGVFLFF